MRGCVVFPKKEAFYSALNDSSIDEDEYEHACAVWVAFKCVNMLEYCELYCRLDVLLLAEAYENFRSFMFENVHLDPAYFLGLPSLSFNAMLNMTKVKLELLKDITMVDFVERGLRGGVSFIPNKFVDSKADNREIKYIDANNLYGLCQMQRLPLNGYYWDESESLTVEDIQAYDHPNAGTGCFLEVDLDYPTELHKEHSDFPLCPEKIAVTGAGLSSFSKHQFKQAYRERDVDSYKATKLSPTLCDKRNVVLHIATLQLYMSLGMQLKTIHRVLGFKQTAFLKMFIEFCTDNRKNANTEWEKKIWKLLANACYGKTIENPKAFIDVKICTSRRMFFRYSNQPNFQSYKVVNDKIQIFMFKQERVQMNKPFPVGVAILELAKLFMYNYWYNTLVPALKHDDLVLHLHDTDSFLFSVRKDAFKEKIFCHDDTPLRRSFDFSNLPTEHPMYSSSKHNVPGFFKCELKWYGMSQFVGIRSKCYTYKYLKLEKEKVRTKDKKLGVKGKSKIIRSSKEICKGIKESSRNQLSVSD